MAKIAFNDKAPEGASIVSFGQGEYEFPLESDDPVVLANASAHPWLTVEVEGHDVNPPLPQSHIAPEDDALSAVNSIANDPEAVAAEAERREVDEAHPVAIESGLDQNESVFVKDIAVTTAAAAESEDEADEPVEPAPADEPKDEPVEPFVFTPTDEDKN